MICAGCQVQRECLEFALVHGQVYGIWGGTTPEDRQRDRRRKRRAAATAAKRTVAA
jgi:WhiB family redox-sensing transcriptional regulator